MNAYIVGLSMAGAAAAQAVYGSMSMATALPSVSAGYSAATAAPAGTYTAAASAVTGSECQNQSKSS